jgi:ABC-type multidrug transport system ATPase subunit
MGTTALVALLQPSYDVFNLFDNVMILSHGEIAFLGSKMDAFAHFESLGYRCHPNVNPAESLRTHSVLLISTGTHWSDARANCTHTHRGGGGECKHRPVSAAGEVPGPGR